MQGVGLRAEDDPARSLGPRGKARLALEVTLLYARVRYLLPRRPLPDVIAGLRSLRSAGALEHPAAPFRLAWAVERVLGRLPGDTRCLVRSLVVVGLLERRSVSTTLVIGVQPGDRLKAHAWVEAEGRPLLHDGGGRYERLTEL